jgi:hypothetical protein
MQIKANVKYRNIVILWVVMMTLSMIEYKNVSQENIASIVL